MQSKTSWNDMSPRQRTGVVAATVVQFALLGAALRDLRRRPADEVRGSKSIWTMVSFINFIGPLAYFRFGRSRRT